MDLITKIKNALKVVGLDEALSSKINVKEESEISGAIANLKKEIDSKPKTEDEWLKTIEGSDNEKYLKSYMQRETDRRVTEGVKTHDENLNKKRLEDEQKLKDDEKNEGMSEHEKTIAELVGQVKSLTESFTNLQGGINQERNSTLIKTAIKNAGLPESLADQIVVKSPEDIQPIIDKLKTENQVILQSQIDELIKKQKVPQSGIGTGTVAEDKVIAHAKAKNNPEESAGFKGVVIPGSDGNAGSSGK